MREIVFFFVCDEYPGWSVRMDWKFLAYIVTLIIQGSILVFLLFCVILRFCESMWSYFNTHLFLLSILHVFISLFIKYRMRL